MKKKIYIADDEANIRLAIKAFLENAGFIVCDFENGDLLLTAFLESPADLVILDVMMPGSNGFVICKELRQISEIPIIILTARDTDLDYATGLDLGSDDFLTKPFSPMALVMRVKAIFRRMDYDRQTYNKQDPMTGLYHKAQGMSLIEQELKASDDKSLHALMVIDIDNLKEINENFGYAFGDQILIEAAQTLSKLFDASDIICRLGGDEFIIFMKDITELSFVSTKAGELNNALYRNYEQDDKQCQISASIGIASYQDQGNSLDELLSCAGKALSHVKKNGKNGHLIYGGEIEKT